MVTPVTPEDPIIGAWMCYSCSSSGRIKKVFTFMKNNSCIRTITNLKSRVRGLSPGTWKKERDGNYLVTTATGSIVFQHNSTSDEMFLPVFQEIYHRVSVSGNPDVRAPTMIIRLYGAQSTAKIQGSRPSSGNTFLVINVSVENVNKGAGYSFDDRSIWVAYDNGAEINAMNKEEEGRLGNPFPPGIIAIGETRQGNVVFAVPENTHSYTVYLVDSEAEIISNRIEFESSRSAETGTPDPE
jgi:hypothetical protein